MVPIMPGEWIQSVFILLAIGLSTALFFIAYRYFPHRRVPAARGAVRARSWRASSGRRPSSSSAGTSSRWAPYDRIYGPLGALVALSMFAYYSGVVFVLGAEFTARARCVQPPPRESRGRYGRCARVGGRQPQRCRKESSRMLKDKIAVVTGAARGIGREIALLMASRAPPSS